MNQIFTEHVRYWVTEQQSSPVMSGKPAESLSGTNSFCAQSPWKPPSWDAFGELGHYSWSQAWSSLPKAAVFLPSQSRQVALSLLIRRSVAIRLQKSGEHRHWLPLFSFLACLFICIWLVSMRWTPHWDYEAPLDMITGDSPSPLSLSLTLWHLLASSIRRTIHSSPLSASDPPSSLCWTQLDFSSVNRSRVVFLARTNVRLCRRCFLSGFAALTQLSAPELSWNAPGPCSPGSLDIKPWEMIMFVFCCIAEHFLPLAHKGLVGCGGVILLFFVFMRSPLQRREESLPSCHTRWLFLFQSDTAAWSLEVSCLAKIGFLGHFYRDQRFRVVGPQ